jgi:hypothetical protein
MDRTGNSGLGQSSFWTTRRSTKDAIMTLQSSDQAATIRVTAKENRYPAFPSRHFNLQKAVAL